MQPTPTPKRYSPSQQEPSVLHHQIGRLSYWRQHTQGARARCCDAAIAIAECLAGIERSPTGPGKGQAA